MNGVPKFHQRVARLPEVVNFLAAYPDGLPLSDVAARFEVDDKTLRQDLVSYVDLQSWGWSFDIFRKPAIEFVQSESDDDGDSGSVLVRVVPETGPALGVEHLSAGDLAVLYTAGTALLEVHPDDADLAAALGVIAETMYGEPSSAPSVGDWNRHLRELQDAQEQKRKVRIVYSRTWHQGVSERVIEPLRLVQTRRGWEVDAGPVGPEGNLRTFILSNVRSAEVLEEFFEQPAHVDRLLREQRTTTPVRLELTQDGRWAARLYAESVEVLDEDEETVAVKVELLPPVGERVALILLASGPSARVLAPGSLNLDASAVFEQLLEHHLGSEVASER